MTLTPKPLAAFSLSSIVRTQKKTVEPKETQPCMLATDTACLAAELRRLIAFARWQ